jgi:hypothetical protein
MPFKDPEKKKLWEKTYHRQYWERHKDDPVFRERRKQAYRNWERKNRERRLRYARERRVGRDGKTFYVKKRPWTGFCELCGKIMQKNLMYHEFDDNTNGIGIWVCGRCHRYCHGYDHLEYMEKYLKLKSEILGTNKTSAGISEVKI